MLAANFFRVHIALQALLQPRLVKVPAVLLPPPPRSAWISSTVHHVITPHARAGMMMQRCKLVMY